MGSSAIIWERLSSSGIIRRHLGSYGIKWAPPNGPRERATTTGSYTKPARTPIAESYLGKYGKVLFYWHQSSTYENNHEIAIS
jgi:hypothetical protein